MMQIKYYIFFKPSQAPIWGKKDGNQVCLGYQVKVKSGLLFI